MCHVCAFKVGQSQSFSDLFGVKTMFCFFLNLPCLHAAGYLVPSAKALNSGALNWTLVYHVQIFTTNCEDEKRPSTVRLHEMCKARVRPNGAKCMDMLFQKQEEIIPYSTDLVLHTD